MEIKVTQEGAQTSFAIEGHLDTITAPDLEKFVEELYEKGINDLVVDMSDCTFVSSAGLRVIVAMQKHASEGGSVVFRNVHPDVMEVFQMTRLDRVLTFEE